MKKILFTAFIAICIAPSFISCQKEDLGNLDAIFTDTAAAGPIAQMTAKINGVPWSATAYDITLEPGYPGKIIITGQSDDGRLIELLVNKNVAGDYLLSKYSFHIGTYVPDSLTTSYYNSNQTASTGGVINIANIDSSKMIMSGEFNFISARSDGSVVTITDGKFLNLGYSTIKASSFRVWKNYGGWIPESLNAAVVDDGTPTIDITANNQDGSKIILSMPQDISSKITSYKLGATGSYVATYSDASGTVLIPNEGSDYNKYPYKIASSLVIKSNDTKNRIISGTFSFYGSPSSALTQKGASFTSGSFNVSY